MITIVSGLPRSGTSMMMQMLEAGGMPVLIDDRRSSDADNPRGYYEYEPVKRLHLENGWMSEAEGMAIKVVSPLLESLPAEFEYRIVVMQRDLDEVLRSQEEMLKRRGVAIETDCASMRRHFERHIAQTREWLQRQDYLQHLECRFVDVIQQPETAAARIAEFLESDMDQNAMSRVVEPTLCRQTSQ